MAKPKKFYTLYTPPDCGDRIYRTIEEALHDDPDPYNPNGCYIFEMTAKDLGLFYLVDKVTKAKQPKKKGKK